MTPTDLIFLYFCAAAVSWAGYGLKVWEERDLERIRKECIRRKIEGLMRQKLRIFIRAKIHELIGFDVRENWIPSKFCTNEYLINEVENRVFIDALWPKRPNPESDPTDCIESENRKA